MHSPSDPDTVPVVSLNDLDGDVWASSSSSSRPRHSLTPSFKNTPPSPARPSHSLHKWRTSENTGATSRPKDPWKIQHSRAESSDIAKGHPLKRDSGGFSLPVFNDPTVTRPILNLRLSPGPTVDVDKDPFEVEHGVETGSDEKEELVLVHEVVTTDSLEGVSLKYGISMADLRKANQMWPSDSIHLRKCLNVPVNKASKLKELNVGAAVEVHKAGSPSSTTLPEAMPDIRRIPFSHLSFFPQGSPSDVPSVDTTITNPRPVRMPNSGGGGLSSVSQSSNSSFIFSTFPRAFPIAKEAIMSRLSLDSGGTPPKEEQEHEMGVVGRNHGANGIHSSVFRQGRTMSRTSDQGLREREGRRTGSRNYDAYETGEEERERASTVIRTSQLEPSPEMLVPVLGQKRAKGERGSGV